METIQPRVLIVDDAPENIWILADVLKDFCTVMTARDGLSAIKIATGLPKPDIILLDILMPEMDGYEVCTILKAHEYTSSIPVIFVSSQAETGYEAKGLALGAADYISKPFEPALVRARVRTQLEVKRHRDHLDALVAERTHELLITRTVTIEALATLAEWRDPETGAHIRRTQSYVRILAVKLAENPRYALELTPKAIEMMTLSAPLHDLGKISVPDKILHKPAALSIEEMDRMREHTTHGEQAMAEAESKLGDYSFLHYAREIAHYHHERWDGTGYPNGLKGENIPLCARIMAVADVYDALISKRPYKDAYPHEKAMEIILAEQGSHFDPTVVDALIATEEKFKKIQELPEMQE